MTREGYIIYWCFACVLFCVIPFLLSTAGILDIYGHPVFNWFVIIVGGGGWIVSFFLPSNR